MLNNARYTVGRACAVFTRPACLFVANNYLSEAAATALAVVFLASSLALVGTAADTHRRFYLRQFDTEQRVNSLIFYVYLVSLLLLGGLGCVVVAGVVWHYTQSAITAAVALAFFISEKLADEVLRLRLFENDFDGWGRVTILRSVLHAAGLGVTAAIAGVSVSGAAIVAVMAAGSFVVFLPHVPASVLRALAYRRRRTLAHLLVRSVRLLRAGWMLWAIALLGACMGYLDRIVALSVATDILPLFMLVVMAFSLVNLVVDFYYVSAHRRDFLQRRLTVGQAFRSSDFLGSLGAGLGLAIVACVAVLQFSRNGSDFPIAYVLVIATLQLSVTLALMPQQVLYWSGAFPRILGAEAGFWVLFAGVAGIVRLSGLSSTAVFAAVAGCAIVRLAAYLVMAGRVTPLARPA